MYQDISFLSQHFSHPIVMIFEQILYLLFLIIIDWVDLVLNGSLFFELGYEIISADTDGCDILLVNNIFGES